MKLPVEKFTPSTVYKELDGVGVIDCSFYYFNVDEEFDKFLTGADLRSVSTIEELYGLIQTK